MPARTNGFMPDSAEAQLTALLDATVDELEQRHDLLKAELTEVTAKLARYKKLQAAGEAPATKAPKGSSPRKQQVSADLAERVFGVLKAAGEPRTVRAIAEEVGVSRGAVDAAVKSLRDDERVRFAGKDTASRGTHPALWATFPEAPPPPPAVGPIRPPKDATRQRVLDAIRDHGQPATFAAIAERSGVGDVALRNAVHALEADGAIRDAGPAPERADGATHGKMPRTYVVA